MLDQIESLFNEAARKATQGLRDHQSWLREQIANTEIRLGELAAERRLLIGSLADRETDVSLIPGIDREVRNVEAQRQILYDATAQVGRRISTYTDIIARPMLAMQKLEKMAGTVDVRCPDPKQNAEVRRQHFLTAGATAEDLKQSLSEYGIVSKKLTAAIDAWVGGFSTETEMGGAAA